MNLLQLLRQRIGALAGKVCPSALERVRSRIWERHFQREYGPLQREVKRILYGNQPIEVLSGPFRGMHFPEIVGWGSLTSRWIGTYERELQPWVEEAIAHGYQRLINVGCAEGYYACGFARRVPQMEVYAFDIQHFARKACTQLAAWNAVSDRVHISGECGAAELNHLCRSGALVLCDIEGGELQLLDPATVPELLAADLIVEVHHAGAMSDQQVCDALSVRFATTHSMERLEVRPRTQEDVAEELRSVLSPALLARAIDESRSDGRIWLRLLQRKQAVGESST